ncbi:MAG: HNH endonuclease [Phycisphaerales bacterium]|nr:HNH endonuclease [Phycisphaerales bacterium]
MSPRPANDGKAWTREQLILGLELYCRVPFGRITTRNPKIRQLAELLERTPASVTRKLGNFGAFDPALAARNVTGLTHVSHLDRQVWGEFSKDWGYLVEEAATIRAKMAPMSAIETDPLFPQGPTERLVTGKQRLRQSFFRDAVLSSYNARCCITGIPVVECLIAAHIIPWSVNEARRTDPTNGLCMSATFEKLFDAGLIAIGPGLKVQVSGAVRDLRDGPCADNIVRFHGSPLQAPSRFAPDPECLNWHRQNVFKS